MDVLVEYDYAAQNTDELTIKKGDRIRNVTRKEDGWYEGELVSNGRRGVFPDNFVKPIKQSAVMMKHNQIGFNGLNTNPTSNGIKSPENKKKPLTNGNNTMNGKFNQTIPSMSPPP